MTPASARLMFLTMVGFMDERVQVEEVEKWKKWKK
jgi:hypothetical protein